MISYFFCMMFTFIFIISSAMYSLYNSAKQAKMCFHLMKMVECPPQTITHPPASTISFSFLPHIDTAASGALFQWETTTPHYTRQSSVVSIKYSSVLRFSLPCHSLHVRVCFLHIHIHTHTHTNIYYLFIYYTLKISHRPLTIIRQALPPAQIHRKLYIPLKTLR